MIIGIVGSEAAKFTAAGEADARHLLRGLLTLSGVDGMSSGHCHLGGIDIWAEEIASELGVEQFIFPPRELDWSRGYKPRNIQIARKSGAVYCITVDHYPTGYHGMRFGSCYHCGTSEHIKSGGCWTVKYARQLGKQGRVLVVSQKGGIP